MNLISLLWKERRAQFVLACCLFLTHLLLNIVIIGTIGRYTSQLKQPPATWWLFALVLVCAVGAQFGAQLLMSKISHEIASWLRSRLLEGIAGAPLAVIERIGPSKIQTAFIEDVQRISTSLNTAVFVARDGIFILGFLAFLAWLSPKLIMLVIAMLVLSFVSFALFSRRAMPHAMANRSANDKTFAAFGNAIAGIKQLKTSAALEAATFFSIRSWNFEAERSAKSMAGYFNAGIQLCVVLYFGVLVLLTYVRIDNSAGADVVSAYVFGLMLIQMPLMAMVFSTEQASMGRISLQRVLDLIQELDTSNSECAQGDAEPKPLVDLAEKEESQIRTFELRNVRHTYLTAERQEFELGPVNVKVKAGESLFVVGGNGTGKTTLVKLLTGLYTPVSGEIRVNDVSIDARRRSWLRGQFSSVFSDICLFESLAGSQYDRELSARGAQLLEELRLDKAIHSEVTLLGQAASCSSGERKRIAMLLARIEDRPIYVFDEFAADQDPASKDLFYDEVLEDLKRAGKIVVVVTHDERYFDRADHLLMLERGFPPKVVQNSRPRLPELAAARVSGDIREGA